MNPTTPTPITAKKKISAAATFFALALFAAGIFVCTLLIFIWNMKSQQPLVIAGRRTLLQSIAAENAADKSELYKLPGNYGLNLTGEDFVTLVQYAPSTYPLAFACGTNQLAGTVGFAYPMLDGDYLFSKYPDLDNNYEIFNTKTQETTKVKNLADFPGAHLSVDTAIDVTQDYVRGHFEMLPFQKESCITITAAEIIVLAGFSITGVAFSIVAARKAKKIA